MALRNQLHFLLFSNMEQAYLLIDKNYNVHTIERSKNQFCQYWSNLENIEVRSWNTIFNIEPFIFQVCFRSHIRSDIGNPFENFFCTSIWSKLTFPVIGKHFQNRTRVLLFRIRPRQAWGNQLQTKFWCVFQIDPFRSW